MTPSIARRHFCSRALESVRYARYWLSTIVIRSAATCLLDKSSCTVWRGLPTVAYPEMGNRHKWRLSSTNTQPLWILRLLRLVFTIVAELHRSKVAKDVVPLWERTAGAATGYSNPDSGGLGQAGLAGSGGFCPCWSQIYRFGYQHMFSSFW